MTAYGHTHPDFPHDLSKWESLPEHLRDVATKAAGFAAKFGCAELARAIGHWHDLGKFSDAFQRYLRDSNGDTEEGDGPAKPGRGPDHSTAGARHAVTAARPGLGHLLAYAIAGHHAGLADGLSGQPGVAQESTLEHRLKHTAIKPWKENAEAALSTHSPEASDQEVHSAVHHQYGDSNESGPIGCGAASRSQTQARVRLRQTVRAAF